MHIYSQCPVRFSTEAQALELIIKWNWFWKTEFDFTVKSSIKWIDKIFDRRRVVFFVGMLIQIVDNKKRFNI